MYTKSIPLFIWFVFIVLSANLNAATSFLYELVGKPDSIAPSKAIVHLPPPLPLDHPATADEKRKAEEFSQEAARYGNGYYPTKNCPPNPKEKLLNLYKAACLGENTACTILARYYRTGEYGLGPDEARAKMYEDNMKWWEPPVAPTLPVLDAADITNTAAAETLSASSDESGSRRSSGDSDRSTTSSAGSASEPASVLRHRTAGTI